MHKYGTKKNWKSRIKKQFSVPVVKVTKKNKEKKLNYFPSGG